MFVGGFSDDQQTVEPEDRRGHGENLVWWTKPAGDHGIDRCAEQAGERRRVRRQHIDTILNTEPVDETSQVVGAGRPAIDQDEMEVGSHPADHEPGDPSSAAEVDDRAGHADERREERRAVLDHVGDRRRSEHPETSGGIQRPDELRVVEARIRAWSRAARRGDPM